MTKASLDKEKFSHTHKNGYDKPARNQQPYLRAIRRSFKAEKLVMVLGAGLSINFGIPSWKNLLRTLLVATIEDSDEKVYSSEMLAQLFTRLFGLSPLAAGRYLQAHFDSKQATEPFAFENALRQALYAHISYPPDEPLMKEIVNFCAAPGKSPNLDSVITYNYDDLLERAMTQLDVSVPHKAIYDAGMNPEKGELPIYHVHGFLPQKGKLREQNRVAFGENIYHHQYNEIYSWRNIVQINKFRDASCLFIGISLTDPNMRRLLDIARLQKGKPEDYHYIFRKRYDTSDIAQRLRVIQHEELMPEGWREAIEDPNAVSESLIRVIERYEEADALSFDVRTIWVNTFEEIPALLAQIRQG